MSKNRIRDGIKGIIEGWTLEEFDRYAGEEVRRLANKMLGQQSYIPLELDDLVQVMLFTIWDRCVHWDGSGSAVGYVMWHVQHRIYREMMFAKGLKRDGQNQWVGAALIPMDEETFESKVSEGRTPEELISVKSCIDEFIAATCTTERQSVLVMHALKDGIEHGAKLLCERENIETLGLVRDIRWIQKAITRALKRAKKEYYGDETYDEAEGGEDYRRCESEGSEGGNCAQSLSTCEKGCEQDVEASNGVARRKRTRSRKRNPQSSALVSSCDAC